MIYINIRRLDRNNLVSGGCDPDKRNCGEMVATSTTYCLNIHSSEWIQKSEMKCNRSHHGLVAFQGKLYAIGGRDHNGSFNRMEQLPICPPRLFLTDFSWQLPFPLSLDIVLRFYLKAQSRGIGLSDDSDTLSYPVLSSVLSYDVAKDSWMTRPPLRCPRAYASCVLVDNALWLLGGASKDRTNNALISMASVDKYYPDEAQWMRRTLLNIPRHAAAIVAVGMEVSF
ncbi:beta-scruin [Caerostris extrusa]|uniref:Beta-scruin n=1 Tax=Caerostris extrusa TaxID=172846 RepID=A0AAV4VKG9_CAEEX|nr:beta-scruin [Caerostris extrusa]